MMEGWAKVLLDETGEPVELQPRPGFDREVPVVPCDDAAIERAARAMRAQNLHLSLDTCRERIERYFRAAGERPLTDKDWDDLDAAINDPRRAAVTP